MFPFSKEHALPFQPLGSITTVGLYWLFGGVVVIFTALACLRGFPAEIRVSGWRITADLNTEFVSEQRNKNISHPDLQVTYLLYNFSTEMTLKRDIDVEEIRLRGREKLEKGRLLA